LSHLLTRHPELEPHTEQVKALVGMLHRQGLPVGQPFMPVVNMMVTIESHFLRRHNLSRSQRRRIQCLTACWIIWGVLQAGRLRPSREVLTLLWQARVYWVQFCLEGLYFGGVSFVADCVKRFLLAKFQPRRDPALS
jgi:hypothetical protein